MIRRSIVEMEVMELDIGSMKLYVSLFLPLCLIYSARDVAMG